MIKSYVRRWTIDDILLEIVEHKFVLNLLLNPTCKTYLLTIQLNLQLYLNMFN
jgi:hypothetical protein